MFLSANTGDERVSRGLRGILVLGISMLLLICLAVYITNAVRLTNSMAESLENGSRVEEESELTYYLTVKYDGVDKYGIKSNDSVTASINSGYIEVSDKIPEGLAFVGFVTTESGTIGAVSRGDASISCSGRVIDDTNEGSDDGAWNAGHTEFTYHGLHYDVSTRMVTFRAENVKAGCDLTVGIITETPKLGDVSRKDFFNAANIKEGILNLNSNTVHVWMGREDTTLYTVTYRYTGDVPNSASNLPNSGSYAEGVTVGVAPDAEANGYEFSGWTTSDATVVGDSFAMPSNNVELVGTFTRKAEAIKYTVSYVIDGDAPDGYVPPKSKQYEAEDVVSLDSMASGDMIDDYTFIGWTSTDASISETGFIMPSSNVVIHGSFTRQTYKVTYKFEGDILPSNWEELLPTTAEYPAGVSVTTAANPSATGYRFTGWYKNATFTMPAENVVIYGEWSVQSGVFSPEITKRVTNYKEQYRYGDTVNFEISVKNTATFAIKDVQILETLSGVVFLSGDGYEVKNDQFVLIPSMQAGETILIKAKFDVGDNETHHYTNIAQLSGAIADGNYYLDTDKDYTATADFDTENWQDSPVLTGIFTNSTTLYIILALVGVLGAGVCVVISKHKR